MAFPFDQTFKILAGDDPRGFLAGFAGIPLEIPLQVEALDGELNRSALRVDKLYRCQRPGEAPFLIHFEAIATFRPESVDKQLAYIPAIWEKYRLPVRSYMLLLREESAPARLPAWVDENLGDQRRRTRIRAVRLWRFPAARLLKLQRPALYPWTALAKASGQEVREASARLLRARQDEFHGLLEALFELRYSKGHPLAQEIQRMPMQEIFEQSPYFQSFIAKYNNALEEGREVGLRAARRQDLTRILTLRFENVPDWAVDKIAAADDAALELLLDRSVLAPTLEAVFE